jgi:hypothetical protein
MTSVATGKVQVNDDLPEPVSNDVLAGVGDRFAASAPLDASRCSGVQLVPLGGHSWIPRTAVTVRASERTSRRTGGTSAMPLASPLRKWSKNRCWNATASAP